MKASRLNRLLSVLLTLSLLLSGSALFELSAAADQYYNGSGSRGYGTFAADTDIATVTIDETKLTHTNAVFETTDPKLLCNTGRYKTVYYSGSLTYNSVIPFGSFSYTFADAAVLSDGTRRNVKIIFDNLSVRTSTTGSGSYTDTIYFARAFSDAGFPTVYVCSEKNNNSGNSFNSRYGLTGTISYVVEGASPKDTFISTVHDINVARPYSSFLNIYDAPNNNNYAEAFRADVGYGPTYIPSSDNLMIGSDGRYVANGTGAGRQKSEIVSTANAAQNVATFWSSGAGPLEFYLLVDGVTHTMTSSSGAHGKIQLWSNGQIDAGDDKLLFDSKTVADGAARTFDVPDGKTVTYKLTPDTGYLLDKLEIGLKGSATTQVAPTQTVYNPDHTVKYYTYTFDASTIKNSEIKVSWKAYEDLIIRRYDGRDEQDFWYAVTDTVTGAVTEVCIPVGKDQVVVTDVYPERVYSVTEKADWSWRYGSDVDLANSTSNVSGSGSVATVTVQVGKNANIVTFQNERNDNAWLGGFNRQDNHFTHIIADPITQENWVRNLGRDTEFTGNVWSDKSLTTADSTTIGGILGYNEITVQKTVGADFLVDFSVLSSNVRETKLDNYSYDSLKLDVVFVVDRSDAMNNYSDNAPPVPLTDVYEPAQIAGQITARTTGSDTAFKNNLYLMHEGQTYPFWKMEDDGGVDTYYFNLDGDVVTRTLAELQTGTDLYIQPPYLYTIYQGATDFIDNLNDQDADVRAAVVGFGENGTGGYTGTGYYAGDTWVPYNNEGSLKNAFFTIEYPGQHANFDNAIHHIPAEMGSVSYVDLGLEMACKIFERDPSGYDPDRRRAVILVKDGVIGTGFGSGDGNNVAADALSWAVRLKNDLNAKIYAFGFYPGVDPEGDYSGANPYSGDTGSSEYAVWAANNLLSRLSSNNGTVPAYGETNYFLNGTSTGVSEFLRSFASGQVNSVLYNEGSPFTTGTAGNVVYEDALGDYMEVMDINAIVLHNSGVYRQHGNPVQTTEGGKTVLSYTFANVDGDGNITSDILVESYLTGASVPLSGITIKVTKGGSLQEGDKIEIDVPPELVPLRTFNIVDFGNGEATVSVDRDRPLHVFYSTRLKQDAHNYLRGQDVALSDADQAALEAYVASNRQDDTTVAFYANAWDKTQMTDLNTVGDGAGDQIIGGATVTFTPSLDNHYYYFYFDTPLYTAQADGHQKLGASVTKEEILSHLDRYHFHIYHYDFDDPRLADGAVPENHVVYKAKKVTDTPGALYECDGFITADNLELKDGVWCIPAGTVKLVHRGTLHANKVDNYSGTADKVFYDRLENGVVTEYLGNNGTAYVSYTR